MPTFLTPTLLVVDSGAIVAIVFVSVLVILGIWEKILLFRARSWPIAQGTIDSAWVHEHKGKRHRWIARLDYSFPLQQRRYTGRYSKTFNYQDEADDFVRDLTGKSLRVHYSSRWPVFSVALKQDVETLLQARPVAEPEPVTGWQPAPVSLYKKLLAYPFMLLGLAGFLVSLYVHIAAWFGQIVLPQSWLLGLHIGMFPPFFVSMFLSPRALRLRRQVRSDQAGNFLNTAMMVVFFYALANFVLGMSISAFHHGQMPPVQEWKLFSGHWMLFYFWSFAILYQAVHPEQKTSVLS